jgi:hypothetical protein
MMAAFPFEPFLRSSMFNQLVANRNKSPESRALPGAPPDTESATEPPIAVTPCRHYSEKSALHEPPYKPYTEKPVDESPYEPYKGI